MARRLVATLMVGAAMLATSAFAACSPAPAIQTACAGDPSEPACAPLVPSYTAADCQSAGRQWGEAVNRLGLEVMNGPASVGDEAQSVRLHTRMVVSTTSLGLHLDDRGILGECSAAELLEAADGSFTDEFRAGVAGSLYDGDPAATWDQFLVEATRVLKVFDAPAAS